MMERPLRAEMNMKTLFCFLALGACGHAPAHVQAVHAETPAVVRQAPAPLPPRSEWKVVPNNYGPGPDSQTGTFKNGAGVEIDNEDPGCIMADYRHKYPENCPFTKDR